MPTASEIQITVDGDDVTNYVQPAGTRFSSLSNAQPGSFELLLKDQEQELSFVTGSEIICLIDGVPLFGGYVTSITQKFAFPVVDTATRAPTEVQERLWVLRGSDYNILFDKRVLRNPLSYKTQLQNFSKATYDGALIREALTDNKYFDIDDTEFDVISEVDDVVPPFDPLNEGATGDGAWVQQGSTMRIFMEDLVQFSGAVYYFSASKKLHHKALDDVEARWGFSDVPNNDSITAATGYQDSTIGFRDLDATMDGGPSTMVNDALVWGGSEWAGSGQTLFRRVSDATSISSFGRWQLAELHFAETGYKQQLGVDARAHVIVEGDPGSVGGDPARGLRYPQWNITLSWFAHDVPTISGTPDHLEAGNLVNIELHVFGDGSPQLYLLPLRSLEITFPSQPSADNTPANPKTWVQFRGNFSLQLTDPYTLWRYLLKRPQTRPLALAVVDGSNPAPYGALLQVEPIPTPNGSNTVFDLPDNRGYIAGTTEVYINGGRKTRGTHYFETNPDAGVFTFATAPAASAELFIICRVTGV